MHRQNNIRDRLNISEESKSIPESSQNYQNKQGVIENDTDFVTQLSNLRLKTKNYFNINLNINDQYKLNQKQVFSTTRSLEMNLQYQDLLNLTGKMETVTVVGYYYI